MKKHLFWLPFLLSVLFACKNPAGLSTVSVAPSGGAMKAKVQFDPVKIKCYNRTTSQYINSGSVVKEQDSLRFEARLSGDIIVEAWYHNDVKVQTGGTSYYCGVGDDSVTDEGGQKLIKVRCTFK